MLLPYYLVFTSSKSTSSIVALDFSSGSVAQFPPKQLPDAQPKANKPIAAKYPPNIAPNHCWLKTDCTMTVIPTTRNNALANVQLVKILYFIF